MSNRQPITARRQPITALATDLDGTFIPLDGSDENRRDLRSLCGEIDDHGLDLIYVTGRHFDLVCDAITKHGLPAPKWLICDVGTSVYQRVGDHQYERLRSYHDQLSDIVQSFRVAMLCEQLDGIGDLRMQEPEKQGAFKLSYYCRADRLESLESQISELLIAKNAPYRIIASVDPFTGEGLIDLLPRNVSKAFALRWWVDHTRRSAPSIVFAGDSGNDLAALTAGYLSIVVSNADPSIIDQVTRAHQSSRWADRLFIANSPATSGVLAGLRFFLARAA